MYANANDDSDQMNGRKKNHKQRKNRPHHGQSTDVMRKRAEKTHKIIL